jgi:hypothetical protein
MDSYRYSSTRPTSPRFGWFYRSSGSRSAHLQETGRRQLSRAAAIRRSLASNVVRLLSRDQFLQSQESERLAEAALRTSHRVFYPYKRAWIDEAKRYIALKDIQIGEGARLHYVANDRREMKLPDLQREERFADELSAVGKTNIREGVHLERLVQRHQEERFQHSSYTPYASRLRKSRVSYQDLRGEPEVVYSKHGASPFRRAFSPSEQSYKAPKHFRHPSAWSDVSSDDLSSEVPRANFAFNPERREFSLDLPGSKSRIWFPFDGPIREDFCLRTTRSGFVEIDAAPRHEALKGSDRVLLIDVNRRKITAKKAEELGLDVKPYLGKIYIERVSGNKNRVSMYSHDNQYLGDVRFTNSVRDCRFNLKEHDDGNIYVHSKPNPGSKSKSQSTPLINGQYNAMTREEAEARGIKVPWRRV